MGLNETFRTIKYTETQSSCSFYFYVSVVSDKLSPDNEWNIPNTGQRYLSPEEKAPQSRDTSTNCSTELKITISHSKLCLYWGNLQYFHTSRGKQTSTKEMSQTTYTSTDCDIKITPSPPADNVKALPLWHLPFSLYWDCELLSTTGAELTGPERKADSRVSPLNFFNMIFMICIFCFLHLPGSKGEKNKNTPEQDHAKLMISEFEISSVLFPQVPLTPNVSSKHLLPSLRKLVNLLPVRSAVHTA